MSDARAAMVWSLALLQLWLLGLVTACGQPPAEINLDTTPWEFEADPLSVGVAERWFSVTAKPTLSSTIRTPGAWQAQGVGNETALETHQFMGIGWYRKTVQVGGGGGAGCSVWLWIGGAPGGVMRSAQVWANGALVGRHVGYLEPLELNLTAAVTAQGAAGEVVLAVAVDSRWHKAEDPLWGGGSMWNPGGVGAGGFGGDGYSFGGYGGIVGNAKLLLRQRAWIEDSVHVACEASGGGAGAWQCAVSLSLAGQVSQADRVSVAVCEWASGGGAAAACVPAVETSAKSGARMTVTVMIPDAKLWAPGGREALANLYTANVTLTTGSGAPAPAATHSARFGIRSLSVDGPRILFNGEPLFLRGYGDDAQYWFTAAPPMDKSYYLSQLAEMKALGFNFIRFHTHSMPDVFHEAADELGFLCDPEFAISYSYMGANAAVKAVYNRSFASLVQRRSHHPSVFGWVLSNEVHWGGAGDSQFAELYRYAKQFDPARPCWFGDGSTIAAGMNLTALGCRDGADAEAEECFMDVWVCGSAYVCGPTSSWRTLGATDIHTGVLARSLPVPMVLHEAVDARTFPRIQSNMAAFEGGLLKAGVIYNQTIARLREIGLWEESDRWALASEKAYSMFMKSYVENYRADPALSGYEWWLGFDFLASSNGIIGGHANNPRPKPGISNVTLASVQRNVILLVREPVALQSTGRRPGEFVPLEILLSNWTFQGEPAWFGKDAELSWAVAIVAGGGRSLTNGSTGINDVTIAQGDTGPVATFGVDIPPVTAASKIQVEVSLQIGGKLIAANEWNLSVFPVAASMRPAKECAVPFFAAPGGLLDAAKQTCSNAAAVPSSLASQSEPFVLMRQGGLSEEDVLALGRAAGFAVLLSPTKAGGWPVCGGGTAVRPPTAVPFAQPWWLSNECPPTNEQSWMTGTLVYNTSLTRRLGQAVVDDGFLSYNFGRVVNGSSVYTLDTLSSAMAASVHIRAIPSDGVYAGAGYQTMVANNALVWEGRVPANVSDAAGSGRFLVSGLNLFNGSTLRADPAAEHAFDQLLSYAVAETSAAAPVQARRTGTGIPAHGCNVSGSFCTVGSEQPCRQPSSGSKAALCNANFQIAVPVCLQRGGTLDSLHLQVQVKAAGTRVIGLVYDTVAPPPVRPATNASFCAASPNSTSAAALPRRLMAKGAPVTAPAAGTAWLRLPLPAIPLPAGIYWIGMLADGDLGCFSGGTAAPIPAIGPGASDAYVSRPFAAGPGLGPGLPWTAGTVGMAMYATVAAQ